MSLFLSTVFSPPMPNLSNTSSVSEHKSSTFLVICAFFAFFAIIAAITGLSEFIRNNAPSIDLANLISNEQDGIPLLASIAAVPFILFLLFQTIIRWLHQYNISILPKGIALILASLIGYLLSMVILPIEAQDDLAITIGSGLLIAILFEIFTNQDDTGFGWALFGLILITLFSSGMLWGHIKERDMQIRQHYALSLAAERDTIHSESQFEHFVQSIQIDKELPFLLKAWPIKPSADSIRDYLSKLVFNNKYIFRYYSLQIYAFDRAESVPFLLDQSEYRNSIEDTWSKASSLGSSSSIRSDYAPDGGHRYLIRTSLQRMNDPNHLVEVFCFFKESFPPQSQIYAQLYKDQSFKDLIHLNRYDFSISHRDQLVVEQGSISSEALNTAISSGKTIEVRASGREETVGGSDNGQTKAVVGHQEIGLLKALYLFAILFAFATTPLLLVGFLGQYLPFKTNLIPSAKGSLGRRIHFSFLGLLAFGFIVIGVVTYRHFSTTSLENEAQKIAERAQSTLTHLRLSNSNIAPDSIAIVLGPKLAQFAQSLNVDANLFDRNGNIVYSTREDLRRIGVLATRMDNNAKLELDKGVTYVEVAEMADKQHFTVRYNVIKNLKQQTIAYIGLPYRLDSDKTAPDLSDFIGILASIYTFLLLAAAGITYLISNSITRPINNIAEKIKELQLEDKNQSLSYGGDSDDEISGLVNEYNTMVNKLEDSKLKLVKLERESAWRDMARQIAHDIKNPLTTMKLSMQQLERLSNDPTQAAAYLKRSTGRLIEQIDSLAQTASEFAMFANLDKTARSPVEINHLVESVFDLFIEQKEVGLSLELPDEKYIVAADKNHLLRVLNNLVINAIQAIPSDREGNVKVALLRIGDNAIIRISDNGGGIPHEIRDRVFEPNFTTKTSGSGLGLAICKKIIEAHDGDIRFETKDNEGTQFFVELPIIDTKK
jgi:two-component system, NtrC family, nitrogen regulation sensor histidine kinase NtrY